MDQLQKAGRLADSATVSGTMLPKLERTSHHNRFHFARKLIVSFWHKTSASEACSDVGDWMMNGHIARSAIRQRLTLFGRWPLEGQLQRLRDNCQAMVVAVAVKASPTQHIADWLGELGLPEICRPFRQEWDRL
jgi:hypothetical protein